MKNTTKNAYGLCLLLALSACENKRDSSLPAARPTAEASTKPVTETPAPKVVTPSPKTYDGPFGLAMGIPRSELLNALNFKNKDEDKPYQFSGVPPKPVSGFETYALVATDGQGLCRISTLEDVNVVNDSGDQLKEETDKIAETLALKYGKYTKKYDFAHQDVYRRNPRFWMMALREKSVTYVYLWEPAKGSPALPNNLASIEISPGSAESGKGWVRIGYEFTNMSACRDEIKKNKSAQF